MNEKQYFMVTVKIAGENAKGKLKYHKEKYLTEGINMTDVEKKVIEYIGVADGEIVQVSAANIIDIIR